MSLKLAGLKPSDPSGHPSSLHVKNGGARHFGYASNRLSSYMFMAKPNPVQQCVLKSWGVEMLARDTDKIEDALPDLLKAPKEGLGALRP
jgi:hypothetical protein